MWLENFNSLPHAEVDVRKLNIGDIEWEFQLTTSRRGRPIPKGIIAIPNKFQLTTSRRGRRSVPALPFLISQHFNSLPHAEVDVARADG